jgi:hypothetical protein
MFRVVMTVAFLLAVRTIGAQVSGLPPRDSPQAARAGTGAIKGRAVDGQTGSPLARARVRLQGPGEPRPAVLTGDAGTFAFTGLPGALYSLTVDKSTYLLGSYPESGDSFRKSDTAFSLSDGQVLDGVTVPLFRGGVISGRVVNSHGEPIELANVQVMRVPRSGRGRPTMRGGGATNDLGEFRLAGLEAGSYVLVVQPRRNVQEDGPAAQPIPTFYPGVSMAEQAQPIAIERSASVTGLEITLIDGTMSRVTGTVVDSSGQAVAGGSVNVRVIVDGVSGGFDNAVVLVKPDGTFDLRLAPGDYLLDARARRPRAAPSLPGGDEQVGTARLTVTGEPLSDVTILVGGGGKVTGRVVFDGSTPTPSSPGGFRVSFTSPGGPGCRTGRSVIAADWTFSVDGLLGTCVAQVNTSPGLMVKAVTINDVDFMDRPIVFESDQQLRNVEVILTNKRTNLTLRVTDDRGQPTREYVALVFSVDKTRWVENSRYIRAFVPAPPPPPDPAVDVTRPAVQAVFAGAPTVRPTGSDSVIGLPQGEYYVVALDDLESEAVNDPAQLESLSRLATRITLTDRASQQASLRRVTAPGRTEAR